MFKSTQYNSYFLSIIVLLISLSASCKKDVKSETVVYTNDFESGDVKNIVNGTITSFNGTHVLGRYNSESFSLTVPNLPKHNLVEVSFDLYIHDSWNGNSLNSGIYGPDLWSLLIDGNSYIHTSFSNSNCGTGPGVFCPPQSYPDNYLNSYHNPKSGAFNTNLPGACSLAGSPNGTTEYKITKTISHNDATLVLQCVGDLVNLTSDPKCEKSWSVDNINIKVIAL